MNCRSDATFRQYLYDVGGKWLNYEIAEAFGVSATSVSHWLRGTDPRVRSIDLLCAGMKRLTPELSEPECYEIVFGKRFCPPQTIAELMWQKMFFEGITVAELCRQSGYTRPTMTRALYHGMTLKNDEKLMNLAKFLRVPVREVYRLCNVI